MMRKILTPALIVLALSISCDKKVEENKTSSGLGQYAQFVRSITSGIISKTDPLVIERSLICLV